LNDHICAPIDLFDHAEVAGHKVTTLNFCFSGGEAIPLALQERFKLFFNIEITEGCGMSELQIYCMNPPYGAKKVGSIGLPIVDMEMQLIDEYEQIINQSNKTGEILVRGESMCSGYWQDNVLTASTIIKGWFHTGDLAYRDEAGCYWFVSRKVDILRCGAELISPITIESLFYRRTAVKEAAAIALPNPQKANDDKIIVYIVLQMNSGKVSSQDLMDFVNASPLIRENLQQIIIVKQLPYGFTGKIDRRTLRSEAKKQK
jgi:long-chain acyl-CoA synthetase